MKKNYPIFNPFIQSKVKFVPSMINLAQDIKSNLTQVDLYRLNADEVIILSKL